MTPDCDALTDTGVLAQPDSDIAGVGVILAFVLSAYLTLAAVLLAYATGLVDEGLLRPADRLVLRVPSRATKRPLAHSTLRRFVLILSDQQIVTGIAILGAGFQGLRVNTISVYHFQIVIYLAWMSSSVHLSALTLLRPYLYHHRGVMWWRVMGMIVLLVMLLVALVPTVSNDWDVIAFSPDPHPGPTIMGIPASCFWGMTWGDGVNPDSIISFLILILTYTWKLGGLFLSSRTTLDRWVRYPAEGLMERILAAAAKRYDKSGTRFWLWTFRLCLAVLLPIIALGEVLASFSAALWVSVLSLVYGTLQILVPRTLVQQYTPGLAAAENQLSFGQLVPLILLVQPFGALFEFLWTRNEEHEEPYQDYGGTYSYGANLGHFQDGKRLIGMRKMPLLQFMATFETIPWRQDGAQRTELKAFLYTSKVFAMQIFLVHAATAATSIVVFYVDYLTIGYATSGNWFFISLAAAGWLAAAPLFNIVLLPFSRLGHFYKKERKPSVTVFEDLQNIPTSLPAGRPLPDNFRHLSSQGSSSAGG